jgi:two-component system chemotaxis sensor kinase CheA
LLGAVQRGEIALNASRCNLLLNAADMIKEAQSCHLQGYQLASENYQPMLDRLQAELPIGLAEALPPSQAESSGQSAMNQPAPTTQSEGFSPPISIESQPPTPRRITSPEETIRVNISKLDSLMDSIGELLISRMRNEQILEKTQTLREKSSRWQKSWRKARPHFVRLQRHNQNSPEVQALLEFLANNELEIKSLCSELNALRSQVRNDRDNLHLISDQLQTDARRTRMLPIANLFDYFPRMLRDIAREQGKQVNLHIEGAETEVDRQILELAKDPLTHLIRNAVDHGIEPLTVRESAGKPQQGTIRLCVEQSGNNILIEVSDDGCGIDLEAVRQSAIEKKLISAQNATSLSEEETLNLIFQSGLSTTKKVTEFSGRGVGMDVVRSNLEQIHGTVQVTTKPGQGTCFQLLFPLTLATSQILLVEVAGQIMAIPLSNVERILNIKAGTIYTIQGKPAITYAGRPLPLVNLARLLKLPQPEQRFTKDAQIPVLILSVAEKRVAMQVDGFLNTLETVIKNLGRQLRRVRHVAGATILGDGRLVIVLNSVDLMKSIFTGQGYSGSLIVEAEPVRRHRLLVVDDSITTRTLQKHILEKAGYEVISASDGEEAWEYLKREIVHLVISDVNMPNMDGIELTKAIKTNNATANLPVLLVTSLGDAQDRLRGMEAGADAYIVKTNYDQNEIIETIKHYIGGQTSFAVDGSSISSKAARS